MKTVLFEQGVQRAGRDGDRDVNQVVLYHGVQLMLPQNQTQFERIVNNGVCIDAEQALQVNHHNVM
ncbi:hypothetical protein D3C71_2038970 [compost metagenome]